MQGTVIEHQGAAVRPAWIESAAARVTAVKDHAVGNKLYIGWSARGYKNLAQRWLAAYRDDYPQMIASAKADRKAAKGNTSAESDAHDLVKSRRKEYRQHKLMHLGKTAGWSVAGAAGAVTGAVAGGGLIDLAMALGAYTVGVWHGRPERAAGIAAPPLSVIEQADGGFGLDTGQVFMTVDQLPEGASPFPIAQARTPMQLAECVLAACVAEGLPVAEVSDVVRLSWGWQCIVRVSEGTPEAIIKKAGDLETRLDLAANGVRPTPLRERRACTVMRFVDRGADPFASAPGMPYRAPKSMSISDKFRIGTSVGGDPLEVCLAGVMGLWVAASGGGKTSILQALAEGTTACYDNITIDLDPHGDGLEDLHDAVRITARDNRKIEAVLLFFLVMSKARARLRKKLGMGRKWKASPEHPAVTIFFDEFPKASELAKQIAFDLLLVGRKELIEVEIASQGGTKLYLGENFAQMVALKAVGPCKVGDTRAVFGDGAVAEGWLPHRLSPATEIDPKDAGHLYLQGVPGMADEPIEYAVHEPQPERLKKLAAERREAGLVEPDRDSLEAMAGVDLPEYVEPTFDAEGNIKREAPVQLLTWEQLLRLCDAEPAEQEVEEGPARLAVAAAVDVMDKAGVDRMRPEPLVAALADFMPDLYGLITVEELKSLLREAGAGSPVPLGALDGMANPRGFKREALARLL
ncbi:hypothetical protein [Streptomyces sp. 891-h]|uniref:hypothetical protein n=1 Tax=Streptomyces sp. 891-h TaxID=2720714 RepID=UPI001FAAB59D|nr:hypothetical protein [Streptomyces sp. 891-h]UNZ20609.1 hypothetical protein HC362_29635 [Streptomyces sp. 891-h]